MSRQASKPWPDTLFCALEVVSFPAQVIAAYHHTHHGQQYVVVSQDTESHRSAVVSCSAEAAEAGIWPGMPLHLLHRRWPDVAMVERRVDLEQAACAEIGTVLSRYSPEYEVHHAGKAMIDLSRTPAQREQSLLALGKMLRRDIANALPLTALAVGMASSAGTAMIMARTERPDGIRVCGPGSDLSSIAPLDVSMLPGLSPRCRARLKSYGLTRIGQVRSLDKQSLVKRFGAEGEKLYALSHDLSAELVIKGQQPVFVETILDHDINDQELLRQKVRYTADKFCFLLKADHRHVDSFLMMMTYSDRKRSQKTIRLTVPTNDFLTVADHAQKALSVLYVRRVALRSIALIAKTPRQERGQLDLFSTIWEDKQGALAEKIVEVRRMNRFDSVVSGGGICVSRTGG